MIKVFATNKYYDDKGMLIGYTILDLASGQQMNVGKDQLKNAAINKQVDVVNMTLTSDGRFIGDVSRRAYNRYLASQGNRPIVQASTKPVKKDVAPKPKKATANDELIQVFNNGKNISGALVKSNGTEVFENGITVKLKVVNGKYSNVPFEDDKPVLKDIKKKQFKQIKEKLIDEVKKSGTGVTLKVEKGNDKENKSLYFINIENLDKVHDANLVQKIYSLIIDDMITAKNKIKSVDGTRVAIECLTGIADARKAIKDLKF